MATLQDEIVAIRARIKNAQSARDAFRTAGSQGRYLEAYSLVETLKAQLEQLRRAGLRRR